MNIRRSSKLCCFTLLWIILTFLMGFSSGMICEKCGLDFPQVKKHIWHWHCKMSTDATLNDAIPHEDNQQPNGNNIVVNLNNEIWNIDNRSYNPHEENNGHQC